MQQSRNWQTVNEGEDSAAIQAGIDDMAEGRLVDFEEIDARIRSKLGLRQRAEESVLPLPFG